MAKHQIVKVKRKEDSLTPRPKKPGIPKEWSYEGSVKKVKQFVYKWKNLSVELLDELWIAREKLAKEAEQAGRPPKGGTKVPRYSWSQYCKDIGSRKQTVDRWLFQVFGPLKTTSQIIGTTPSLPKGKYNVIYADPPWKYGQEQHGKERQETVLETHYPTMSLEGICELPIKKCVADNAVLFLWVTSPKLDECWEVIEAWGFEYKTSIIWDKIKHNVGYYVSVRHEFLLICTRGSFLPQIKKLYDSVVSIERTKHSEKPEYFRKLIEKLYPKTKKIELFARKKVKGWEVWGHESQRTI